MSKIVIQLDHNCQPPGDSIDLQIELAWGVEKSGEYVSGFRPPGEAITVEVDDTPANRRLVAAIRFDIETAVRRAMQDLERLRDT